MDPHDSTTINLSDPRILDILSKIFDFLTTEDRKSVRLTCKIFSDACNRVGIIKREKLVFRFATDLSKIADYLEHCERLRPTIEFRLINLTTMPPKIWEILGDRITSLFIEECHMHDVILLSIFYYCSNLINFHLVVTSKTKILCSQENLPHLEVFFELQLRRPKLQSFKLFNYYPIPNDIYQNLFCLFPNIVTFGRDTFYRRSPQLSTEYRMAQRSISQQIELPPKVEKFIYNLNANSSWMQPYIDHPTIKLKELEFTFVIMNNQGIPTITKFFSSQTELERVKLRILLGGNHSSLVKYVMFDILENLPKLKALEFDSNSEIHLTQIECAKLVLHIQNLELLDLRFHEIVIVDHDGHPLKESIVTSFYPPVQYPKLTCLRLAFNLDTCHDKYIIEILNRCRSLRSLSIGCTSRRIMKCILKNHTELRKLSLNGYSRQETVSMGEYTLYRLEKLEYLDIRNPFGHFKIDSEIRYISSVEVIISQLDCPNLKVFRLEAFGRGFLNFAEWYMNRQETIKLLCALSIKAPLLETLMLASELPIKEFYPYCRRFKRLHFLVRTYCPTDNCASSPDEIHEIEPLFDQCSSLISIVNKRHDTTYTYWYDRYKKELGPIISNHSSDTGHICKVLNMGHWSCLRRVG